MGSPKTGSLWIKAERRGNTFTSMWKENETDDWHVVHDPDLVPMSTEIYIGLAVTSHNNQYLAEARFENFSTEKLVCQTETNESRRRTLVQDVSPNFLRENW